MDSKGKAKTEQFMFDQTEHCDRAYAALRTAGSSITADAYGRRDITIWIGSMNMGDAPTQDDLGAWIKPGSDIYAFSLQESGYKPAAGGSAEDHIVSQIERQLGADYVQVQVASLGPIRNMVFMRTALAPLLSDVATASEATGVGHVGSNKGGVGISFMLGETSFLFVASHLAAHDEEVERRNSDYREILNGLLKLTPKNICPTTHFNHVFWAGDLNFRITLARDEAVALANAGNLDRLLSRDQLREQRAENKVFFGFEEGAITFTPTYKFEPGTREYDSKKMRTPSYTDRILYACAPEYASTLTQTAYGAVHEIMTSDHSPIYATFTQSIVSHPYVTSGLGVCNKAVKIERLSGRNLRAMDLNGFSDPYVIFSGHCLNMTKDEGRTEIIKKNLNPTWTSEYEFKLVRDDPAYLAMQSILVLVMDEDKTSRDDVIGSGWIHLSRAIADGSFEVPLRHNGVPAGVLTGNLTLVDKSSPSAGAGPSSASPASS